MQQNERFFKHYDNDFDQLFNDLWAHRLYLFLLRNATHREYEYNGMTLKPGHYVRSVSKLVDDIAFKKGRGLERPGRATINSAIKRLESLNLIETEYPIKSVFNRTDNGTDSGTVNGTDSGTLFKVVKMQSYQEVESVSEITNGTANRTDNSIGNGTFNGPKTRFKELDLNNKINNDVDIIRFFQENIRYNLNPIEIQTLQYWEQDYPKELIIEAIKRTALNNVTSLRYTEKILKDWKNQRFLTLDEVKRHEENKKSTRGGYTDGTNKRGPRQQSFESTFGSKVGF